MAELDEENAHQGRFIVFEGLDGAGTSTQLHRLCHYLTTRGHLVEKTREPSDGPFGAMIRLAIEGRGLSFDSRSLALAFAADRCDHTYNSYKGIRMTLASGRWVVSDRYLLSSLAYQNNTKVTLDWLIEINRCALLPDLTVFIDTDPEICSERIEMRSSHSELFHEAVELARVQRNYRELLGRADLTGKLVRVDGNRSQELVFESLLTEVEGWLATEEASTGQLPVPLGRDQGMGRHDTI